MHLLNTIIFCPITGLKLYMLTVSNYTQQEVLKTYPCFLFYNYTALEACHKIWLRGRSTNRLRAP